MTEKDKLNRAETGRKRGLFAPIVLVLLTFSLMGNVFLYAGRLQDGLARKEEQGMAILRQQIEAKSLLADTDEALSALLKSAGGKARSDARYKLGLALGAGGSVSGLIGRAAALNEPGSEEEAAGRAESSLRRIASSLEAAAAHDGPLTEEENTYLSSLQGLFARMSASAAELKTDHPNRETALQARAGGPWTKAAPEWAGLLDQAAGLVPVS